MENKLLTAAAVIARFIEQVEQAGADIGGNTENDKTPAKDSQVNIQGEQQKKGKRNKW